MIRISFRDMTYYHGTNSKKNAEGILSKGLMPLDPASTVEKYEQREELIPMTGGVYLTTDIFEALRYAFWAQSNSGKVGTAWFKEIEIEPYGYIFIFDGRSMDDYLPDEDEVGYLVHSFLNNYKNPDLVWLFEMAKEELTKDATLRQRVEFGSIGGFADLGKRIIPRLNTDQIEQILKYTNNVVSRKTLKPVAYYKIKKPQKKINHYDNEVFKEYMKQPDVMERIDLE